MSLKDRLKAIPAENLPAALNAIVEDTYTRSTSLLRELGLAHEQERPELLRSLIELKTDAVELLPYLSHFDNIKQSKIRMVCTLNLEKWSAIFKNARQSEKKPNNNLASTNTLHNDWH